MGLEMLLFKKKNYFGFPGLVSSGKSCGRNGFPLRHFLDECVAPSIKVNDA